MLIDTVAWVCVRDRRLLCVRTRGKDAFYLPGGKREVGESDWAALVREVKEEVQVLLDARDFEQFGRYRGPAHGHTPDTEVQIACYTASYRGILLPSREIEVLDWFTHRHRRHCAPVTRQILDALYLSDLVD